MGNRRGQSSGERWARSFSGSAARAGRRRDLFPTLRPDESEDTNPRTSPNFGNGEVGGDSSWTAAVFGNTSDGQDVTVIFGQGGREGHTGIASGHVSGAEFYTDDEPRGHDHFGPNGEPHCDSGRYQG